MFTGIIETTGKVRSIETAGNNRHLEIESTISNELKIDQSVSHNGICLTVTRSGEGRHWVTAVEETLAKSNIGTLIPGSVMNLERCMTAGARLDGHIVQGHADGVGTVTSREERDGSHLFTVKFPAEFSRYIVEKGSVAINGISLTCFNVGRTQFQVTIIPYTFEHTTMHALSEGDTVNLEFDIVGKYILRSLALSGRL